MPPFLFNRMQQPLCSFALPPPLPQLGSLLSTPGIQQMVMQRNQNPVAVFPFSSNWQMPQPMIPSFPQVQQQQSLMPVSSFQPISAAPQSYLPAAPQPYGPPLMPFAQQYSQPYMPPSYAMPSNQPGSYLPPPPMFPGSAAPPPAPNYTDNSYPAICRACPPAPPSLGIPVQGHCWVQHCSACHHVPTPVAQPNVRPNGGRVTPLLRYPTVPQYVPDQPMYSQADPHANAPVMMRPWLRKTPPLPPGAVVVSDHYISRNPSRQRHQSSKRPPKSYPRQSSHRQHSSTATTTLTVQTSNVADRNTRSEFPVNQNPNNNNTIKRHEESARSKSVSSATSQSSSASAKSADYNKTTIYQPEPKEKVIPKQLAGEARNVNLKYNYQAQELPSVYLINSYLKSSSEGSSLATHLRESPVSSENSHANASSPIDSNRAKEEKARGSPLPPQTAKSKRIIIRASTTRSPSTVSTISTLSSDAAFSILGKDSDTLSTTSTVKANRSEEHRLVNEAVF